jgi:hypothetical protein
VKMLDAADVHLGDPVVTMKDVAVQRGEDE